MHVSNEEARGITSSRQKRARWNDEMNICTLRHTCTAEGRPYLLCANNGFLPCHVGIVFRNPMLMNGIALTIYTQLDRAYELFKTVSRWFRRTLVSQREERTGPGGGLGVTTLFFPLLSRKPTLLTLAFSRSLFGQDSPLVVQEWTGVLKAARLHYQKGKTLAI